MMIIIRIRAISNMGMEIEIEKEIEKCIWK